MKNQDYKTQILKELFQESGELNLRNYIKLSSESEPDFFRWLFSDVNLADFEAGQYKDEFEAFLNSFNTYDVVFNDDTDSNSKGIDGTIEECRNWIECNRHDDTTYFGDYKGGTVSIVCNETDETVYEEEIK